MPGTPIILDTQVIIDPTNPGEHSSVLANVLNQNKKWIEAFKPVRLLHPETQKPLIVVLSASVYPFTKPDRVSKKGEPKAQEDFFAAFDPVDMASGNFSSVHTVFNTLKKDPASEQPNFIVKTKPAERTRLVKTNSSLTTKDANYADALGVLIKEQNIGKAVAHMGFRYTTSVPDGKNGFLLMRKLPGISLESILYNPKFKVRDRLRVAIKLLQAFQQQITECKHPDKENVHLIHGDIKSFNILLTKDLDVKFIDFGLSRWSDAQFDPENIPGTAVFIDPALLNDSGAKPSNASDQYSLARVLAELFGDQSNEDIHNIDELLRIRRHNEFSKLFAGMDELSMQDKNQIEHILKQYNEYNPKKRPMGVAKAIKVFEAVLQRHPEDKESTFEALFDTSGEEKVHQEKRVAHRKLELLKLSNNARIQQESCIYTIHKELVGFKSKPLKDRVHAIIEQVQASKEIIYAPHSIVVEAYNLVLIQLTLKIRIDDLHSLLPEKFKPALMGFKTRHTAICENPEIDFETACSEVKKLSAELAQLEKTSYLVNRLKNTIHLYVKHSTVNFDNFYKPEYAEFLPDLIELTKVIHDTTYGKEPIMAKINELINRVSNADSEQSAAVQNEIQRYKKVLNLFQWQGMQSSNYAESGFYNALRLKALDDTNPLDEPFWIDFKAAEQPFCTVAKQYKPLFIQVYVLFTQRCSSLEEFKQLVPLFHRSQYMDLLLTDKYKLVIHQIVDGGSEDNLTKLRTLIWDYLNRPQLNQEVEQKLYDKLVELIPQKNFGLLQNFFAAFESVGASSATAVNLEIGV